MEWNDMSMSKDKWDVRSHVGANREPLFEALVNNNLQSTRTSSGSEIPIPLSFSATHS